MLTVLKLKFDHTFADSFCMATVLDGLATIKANNIVIEANLTSNDTLLRTTGSATVALLRAGYRVVLATDNDGIWRCESNTLPARRSVAAEYCFALNVDGFPVDMFGKMIEWTLVSRFY